MPRRLALLAAGLLAADLAAAQPPAAPTPPAAAGARPDSTRRREPRPVRRQQVTPELERSAFADPAARTLLLRARAARLSQDSALRAYDAKALQRLSVGMGLTAFARDRLLFRHESAARVQWSRDNGVWIQPTAARTTIPAVRGARSEVDVDDMAPVPYFPGRETLWIPSSAGAVARAEVDENELIHPLATGAEAYYRYATGDSIGIRLPDGRTIALRELRITARRPDWRAFVGSFWFDVERGSLVRAAYRLASEMDIWRVVDEEQRKEIEEAQARLRADTSAAGSARRRALEGQVKREKEDEVPWWVKGLMNPMRATLSGITVEYGLYEGRFWLPKLNVAEGMAQAGFMRIPFKLEESFRYAGVNGDLRVPAIPATAAVDSSPGDVNVNITVGAPGGRAGAAQTRRLAQSGGLDSLAAAYQQRADSQRTLLDAARARGDTAAARRAEARMKRNERLVAQTRRRAEECRTDSTYFAGVRTRYDGALRVAVRMPCDTLTLARSPDLPASPYEPGEALFGEGDRDALLEALDLSLQPGWGPQPVQLRSGLAFARYNRVEGLSLGAEASSVLGRGYTARAQARLGVADLVPNGELALARGNGRQSIGVAAFHRLGVANDDWGAPLGFGASVANLLFARDEGFYYRTWGAELTGVREQSIGGARLGWRLFGERQRSAGAAPNTQWSLGNAVGNARFTDNIAAERATLLGGALQLGRTWGVDPAGWRLLARSRTEAAWVDRADSAASGASAGYGRAVLDATLTRGLGRYSMAVTGAGGAIAGDAPAQRLFYVGGLQTVRGQFARAAGPGRVGNAFWLGRGELARELPAVRLAGFYDVGWAGARDDLAHPGRPLSGAGVGLSFLDGMVRTDLARGIWPEKRWRLDLTLEARF